MKFERSLFWFRRDLRLSDNHGLYQALQQSQKVACVFIFDKTILSQLEHDDKRVVYIHQLISSLKEKLREYGSDLIVKHGYAEDEIPKIAQQYKAQSVFCNTDYEPSAIQRDEGIQNNLLSQNIQFFSYKDTALFHHNEIVNGQQPFTVFTHYYKKWFELFKKNSFVRYDLEPLLNNFAKFHYSAHYSLKDLGFTDIIIPPLPANEQKAALFLDHFMIKKICNYLEKRDYPIDSGTSYLSTLNRFGLISIREIARKIKNHSDYHSDGVQTWLKELAWRDFYFSILYHFPHVERQPFKKEFIHFQWENNSKDFESWCEARTGYPIVDAAMTQLLTTGYMHNRLRMVCASFLTKHLLIDYRWGEAFFAKHLLDFDLSANNGGWQWSSSCGCDAQPFFRIFNPMTQSEKFDADALFIKKMIPELQSANPQDIHQLSGLSQFNYPQPIIEHSFARKRALTRFELLNKFNNNNV